MLLLALDTATPAVTVALYTRRRPRARRLRARSTPAATANCCCRRRPRAREAGRSLDAVSRLVVGVGPGPYTGLRVGLVTAETFGAALASGARAVHARRARVRLRPRRGPFVVATDARRKEVYWARYADARTRVGEPAVDRPADLADAGRRLPAVGAGRRSTRSTFQGRAAIAPEQSAAALARLAAEKLAAGEEFVPPRPLYLRRPDAQVPTNYKVVTPK